MTDKNYQITKRNIWSYIKILLNTAERLDYGMFYCLIKHTISWRSGILINCVWAPSVALPR